MSQSNLEDGVELPASIVIPNQQPGGTTTTTNNNNNPNKKSKPSKKKALFTPKVILILILVSIGIIFASIIIVKKFVIPAEEKVPDLKHFPTYIPDPDLCFADKNEIKWTSNDGNIYANEIPIQIKGLSYFGNEGHAHTFGSLNLTSIEEVLNWVQGYSFNAIRVPISLEWALSDEKNHLPPKEKYVSNKYKGKSVWDIMDIFIDKAAERGILICLDMHYLEYQSLNELWYTTNNTYEHHASEDSVKNFKEEDFLEGWDRVLDRYGKKWNVFAIDIMNEPFGEATWGDHDPDTNINRFYERAIRYLGEREAKNGFHGLYLVEGTQYNNDSVDGTDQDKYCSYDEDMVYTDCDWPFWWGGNFMGAKNYPIDVTDDKDFKNSKNIDLDDLNSRVVYSPHIYGPDVFKHYYFDFPNLGEVLNSMWDEQTGWLSRKLNKGVLIGEWGGSMEGIDRKVQRYLADWLVENCMTNQFWWALNPGSGDVGGLFSHKWQDLDQRKTQILQRVNPNPSQFSFDKNKNLCFKIGAPASPFCRTSYEINKEFLNTTATQSVMNSKTYKSRSDK